MSQPSDEAMGRAGVLVDGLEARLIGEDLSEHDYAWVREEIARAIDEALAAERVRRLPWKQAAKRLRARRRQDATRERNAFDTKVPCGHEARFLVLDTERGRAWCALCALENANREAEEALPFAERVMPCGHAQRYAVHSGGGTGYCALCQNVALQNDFDAAIELAQEPVTIPNLPCGHPGACLVSTGEGKRRCGWCEDVAKAKESTQEGEG